MRFTLTMLSAVAIVACSDSFAPTTENVAGGYSLRTLSTTTDTGGTRSWVAEGATMTIALETNGTTTGHLSIPGGASDWSDFDADMAGTWMLRGDTVFFDQTADTFVKDMLFFAAESRLSAEQNFGGVTLTVVLTK